METGDIYVYAHGNGGIFMLRAEKYGEISDLVSSNTMRGAVAAAQEQGSRVFLGRDHSQYADAVVRMVEDAGPVLPFHPGSPPLIWREGTSALTQAAATGEVEMLEDLVGRGIPIDDGDDHGARPLHHAAARGQVAAIRRLLALGADPTLTNRTGDTPLDMARKANKPESAKVLQGDSQATTQTQTTTNPAQATAPGSGEHRFGYAGMVVLNLQFLLMVFPTAVLVLMAVVGELNIWMLLFFVGLILLPLIVVPLPLSWRRSTPVRLEGTVLHLRNWLGAARTLDIAQARIAGLTGRPTPNRPRSLLLAHPEGRSIPVEKLERLGTPGEEAVEYHSQPIVELILSAGMLDKVVRATGPLMRSSGVRLLPSFITASRWAQLTPKQARRVRLRALGRAITRRRPPGPNP